VRVDNASGTLKAENGNLLGVDPHFRSASVDPTRADFRLATGSRALSAGTPTASPDNLNGEARVTGAAPNLGAY
jgi:hypothetical protein